MNLTRDQLRHLARSLKRGIDVPAKPYDPYEGRDHWTVYHSLCEAYRKHPEMLVDANRERAEYIHRRDRAIASLSWKLEQVTRCDYRTADYIATQIVDEPQVESTATLSQSPERTRRDYYAAQAKERMSAGGKVGRDKQLGGGMANLPCPQSARDAAGDALQVSGKPALPAAIQLAMGSRQ